MAIGEALTIIRRGGGNISPKIQLNPFGGVSPSVFIQNNISSASQKANQYEFFYDFGGFYDSEHSEDFLQITDVRPRFVNLDRVTSSNSSGSAIQMSAIRHDSELVPPTILIMFSCHLFLPSAHIPWDYHTKILYAFYVSSI
jgi:hypothetical protein